jgi:hypothetical protein
VTEKKSKKVNTPVFRVSFPALFEPTSFEDGGPLKYQVTCIVPKDFDDSDHPDPKNNNAKQMRKLRDAIDEVGEAAFGKEWKKMKKRMRYPHIRDGEDYDGKDGYGPEVEFFRLKSDNQPLVVDKKIQMIDPKNPNGMYAGCYAIASVSIYPYFGYGGGVGLALGNVQKIADGDSFVGRTSPEDDFEAWDDDDDDDDDVI